MKKYLILTFILCIVFTSAVILSACQNSGDTVPDDGTPESPENPGTPENPDNPEDPAETSENSSQDAADHPAGSQTSADDGEETTDYTEGQQLLLDYYNRTVGTPMEMPYYELSVYTYDEEHLLLEQYTEGGTELEYVRGYLIPAEAYEKVLDVVRRYDMKHWDEKEGYPITGAVSVCKFYMDDEYTSVSTEHMPEDGFEAIGTFSNTISSYIDEDAILYERYVHGAPVYDVNIVADREELRSYLKLIELNRFNWKQYFDLTSGMGQKNPDGSFAETVNCYMLLHMQAGYFPYEDLFMWIPYTYVQNETESASEAVVDMTTEWYPDPYDHELSCRPVSFPELTNFKKLKMKEISGRIATTALPPEYVYEDDFGKFFYYKDPYTKYYLEGYTGQVMMEGTYVNHKEVWYETLLEE